MEWAFALGNPIRGAWTTRWQTGSILDCLGYDWRPTIKRQTVSGSESQRSPVSDLPDGFDGLIVRSNWQIARRPGVPV